MTELAADWAVCNPGPQKLLVWLEPWAEEVEAPVGSTINLNFSDADPGDMELTPGHLVVWARGGQSVRVFLDRAPQDTASASIPAPGEFGASTRRILEILFRDQPSARLGGRGAGAQRPLSLWRSVKRLLR